MINTPKSPPKTNPPQSLQNGCLRAVGSELGRTPPRPPTVWNTCLDAQEIDKNMLELIIRVVFSEQELNHPRKRLPAPCSTHPFHSGGPVTLRRTQRRNVKPETISFSFFFLHFLIPQSGLTRFNRWLHSIPPRRDRWFVKRLK